MFVSFILFIYFILFYFILFISSAFFFINMVHNDPIQVYVINELGQK